MTSTARGGLPDAAIWRLAPYFIEPLRARKGAALLTLLAIALGVALGVAVNGVNDAALAEFAQSLRTVSGQADLQVRGSRAGFDESLYPRVAQMEGVAAASPAVEFEARIQGREDALRVLGIDPLRAAQLQPALVAPEEEGEDRFSVVDGDAVFLSPAAAGWLGLAVGDTLALQSGLRAVPLRVAGLLPAVGAQQRIAVMDIATAQWRFDRLGLLSRIDLRLRPGADGRTLRAALEAAVPPGVQVLAPREEAGAQAALSRAYRVNLNMLALMALLTGAFLVFSAQSLAVVRRRAELAFLRAAGVTRAMLVAGLVAEGAVLGAAGAALGVALGYALAQLALSLLGGDLGAGYFAGSQPQLRFDAPGALGFFVLGAGAAAAGALAPALEAATAPPARALKAGDERRPLAQLERWWPGALAVVAGLALAALPPLDELPVFGYLGIAFLLLGAILLMPRVARMVFGLLPQGGAAPLQLAVAQLRSVPGHAAVAGAGILASVAVASAMAIMVASFRVSLGDWLAEVLPANLYGRAGKAAETGFLDAAAQAAIRATPGVKEARFVRHQNLLLNPQRPPVALLARSLGASGHDIGLPMLQGGAPRRDDVPPAWISEAMVDLHGMKLGDEIQLPLAGRLHRFAVAGIWRDYARQHGAVVVAQETYRRLSGDERVNDFSLWLAPGYDADGVAAQLRQRLAGGERLDIVRPGEIRAVSLRLFDRSFAVTYALEAVAILIGLFGVAASFAALATARRREFGVLRHLGMTRRQIGAMLAAEGALVSALGVAAGLALGGGIGVLLIRVVNRQSFHWSMDLHLPVAALAGFGITLVVLAALVSVAAARHAMRIGAVRAVREDW